MSDRLLRWTAIHIGRRKFLYSAAAALFGIVAGLSTGRLEVLAGCPCTGPFGSGQCPYNLCYPNLCGNALGYYCTFTYCCCPGGTACWTCPSYGCCDCYCSNSFGGFYCYCTYSIP